MSAAVRAAPVVIKRYGGSRLYDPAGGCYVSRDQLRAWAQAGTQFAVIDAETGADLTRDLLERAQG